MTKNNIFVNLLGSHEIYELIYEFRFNSDWKRQSVIVKFEDNYFLYIKGAD